MTICIFGNDFWSLLKSVWVCGVRRIEYICFLMLMFQNGIEASGMNKPTLKSQRFCCEIYGVTGIRITGETSVPRSSVLVFRGVNFHLVRMVGEGVDPAVFHSRCS